MSAYQGNKLTEPTAPVQTFEEKVLAKLTEISDKLDTAGERLDSIDVRLCDLELDTGDGFERDTY